HLLTRQRLLQFLEQSLVRCVKAEPRLAASDERLALGHSGIIHARLTPQGNGYRVAFGVFRVTLPYVIRPNRCRDFFGFVGIYDGQALEFVSRHHAHSYYYPYSWWSE